MKREIFELAICISASFIGFFYFINKRKRQESGGKISFDQQMQKLKDLRIEVSSSTMAQLSEAEQDLFLCPITQSPICEPVITRYGHTFEASFILKWIAEKQSCPMTRKPLEMNDLRLNTNLYFAAQYFLLRNYIDNLK